MSWNMQRTMDLIKLYRSKTVLWDQMHEHYRSKEKRYEALTEMAQTLRVPKLEVERKIKNLSGQFTREVKKMRHSDSDKPYESKWFGFKHLQFLKGRRTSSVWDFSAPQEDYQEYVSDSDSNVTIQEAAEETEIILDDAISNTSNIIAESINLGSPIDELDDLEPKLFWKRQSPKRSRILSMKRKRDEDILSRSYRFMKSLQQPKDEYALFGEQIACRLRKLTSDRTRSNVQHIISTILWEAEAGKHDNYTPVSFLSSTQRDQNETPYFQTSNNIGKYKNIDASEIRFGHQEHRSPSVSPHPLSSGSLTPILSPSECILSDNDENVFL